MIISLVKELLKGDSFVCLQFEVFLKSWPSLLIVTSIKNSMVMVKYFIMHLNRELAEAQFTYSSLLLNHIETSHV